MALLEAGVSMPEGGVDAREERGLEADWAEDNTFDTPLAVGRGAGVDFFAPHAGAAAGAARALEPPPNDGNSSSDWVSKTAAFFGTVSALCFPAASSDNPLPFTFCDVWKEGGGC